MGEKKRRLAAAPASGPHRAATLVAEAFRALQRGDRPAAEAAYAALAPLSLGDPELLNGAAVVALSLDRPVPAREWLERAVALDGRSSTYHCHLAIAHRRLGQPKLAIAEYEAALRLDPALPEAHANLGNVLLEEHDAGAARASYERALALRPDFPEALNGLGDALAELDVPERASDCYERALALDSGFHEAHYNLARAEARLAARPSSAATGSQSTGDAAVHASRAVASIVAALERAPANPAYWIAFESIVGAIDVRHPVDPRLAALLWQALDVPAVDPSRLARPILGLATSQPTAWLSQELRDDALPDGAVAAILGDTRLQRLLADAVVPNAFAQRVLATARRALLHQWSADNDAEPTLPLPAVIAIAHQSFLTEYVNDEAEDEAAVVTQLRERIAAADVQDRPRASWLALYACYRPLSTLPNADAVAAGLAGTPLESLARRQVVEPREERALRPAIAALTPVTDAVSTAVGAQYEANPYPRWQRTRRWVPPESVAAFLRRVLRPPLPPELGDGAKEILVAGCGTGLHPIGTALRHPEARVLAIDLSTTSLAYALRKTRELGLNNIEYRRADILALQTLPDRFDVIECVGVLHHLADPAAGWCVLRSLLRPQGLMRIGLYSELARRHVVRARALAAELGIPPTPDGIRACRRAILARPDDTLLARVVRGEDFYSLSGCRDLMFHLQEHRFALPRIAALLADLRLEFLGFEHADGAVADAFRAQFPADVAQRDLANWDAFESAHPDTFARMYRFWVRGDDRAA